MKLWAISDLHLGQPANRAALDGLSARPDDWLVLGGDICETVEQLDDALAVVRPRFAGVIWVPGNHELWTVRAGDERGVAKYERLLAVCRDRGVLTPEDAYPVWEGEGGPHLLVPMFLLYDYSFAPKGMSPGQAIAWAAETGIECVDEHLLHPDPYPSREAWCAARCDETARRIEAARGRHPLPTVLINHFPLRSELAVLPAVPRFRIWCGTRRTEDWHRRFAAAAVVYGHLHIPAAQAIDGVRFEEVSLGYTRQWDKSRGMDAYLRPILPKPKSWAPGRRR